MTLLGNCQSEREFERVGHVPKLDFLHFPTESFIVATADLSAKLYLTSNAFYSVSCLTPIAHLHDLLHSTTSSTGSITQINFLSRTKNVGPDLSRPSPIYR